MPGDAVFVRGLEFEGNHGFYEEERRTKRRFRINLEIETCLAAASVSDALGDTLDYFRICQIITEIGTQQTFKLLERLAGQILDELQAVHPTGAMQIEIEKLGPPCPGVPQCCGVRLSRPALGR